MNILIWVTCSTCIPACIACLPSKDADADADTDTNTDTCDAATPRHV